MRYETNRKRYRVIINGEVFNTFVLFHDAIHYARQMRDGHSEIVIECESRAYEYLTIERGTNNE